MFPAASWWRPRTTFSCEPEFSRINRNRTPGHAGGRATEGWPRRGETRGSERVKGHREHREKPGQGRLAERTQTPGAKRRICQFGRHPTREVPRNHPTHSQIDEFAKAAPDPTSGSLLGVFRKATLERNPTPLSKGPKEKRGHWCKRGFTLSPPADQGLALAEFTFSNFGAMTART